MKSTHTTDKSRRNTASSKAAHSRASGQLFLGHKVLGELRILMRLANPNGSGSNGAVDGHGRSY